MSLINNENRRINGNSASYYKVGGACTFVPLETRRCGCSRSVAAQEDGAIAD
jgi:hypothetical protein